MGELARHFEKLMWEGLGLDRHPELLKDYIKSWISAARSEQTFRPFPLPEMGLSDFDKMKIGKRSQILARQMYTNHAQEFIDREVTY